MTTTAATNPAHAAGSVEVHTLGPDGSIEPGGAPLYREIARLMVDAYPVMGVTTAEGFERTSQRFEAMAHERSTAWAVATRHGALVGAMRLYDFVMNVRGSDALTGGLGILAVSLAHKRQGVARAMIAWFLKSYHSRNAALAVLHPFRPDFYRKLGFGYGTPVQRFRFAPASLRVNGARGTVRLMEASDDDALFACSERVRLRTNGLIMKHRDSSRRALADEALRWAGVVDEGGTLRGYMQTSVTIGEHPNTNELVVRDLQAEDGHYRAALLGYLRAQQDQFARITIETQDAEFYLAADDARDGTNVSVAPPAAHRVADTGLGIMYRIVNVERAFSHLPASEQTFKLRVEINDPFVPTTEGVYTFVFRHDRPPVADPQAVPNAALCIGIAELSSLVVGSLRLRDVVRHGLATVEPATAIDAVAALLDAPQPPVCTTRF
jgi:predicted N-acetyltransferase YhbS